MNHPIVPNSSSRGTGSILSTNARVTGLKTRFHPSHWIWSLASAGFLAGCPYVHKGLGLGVSVSTSEFNDRRPAVPTVGNRSVFLEIGSDQTKFTVHEYVWAPSVADRSKLAFEVPADAQMGPFYVRSIDPTIHTRDIEPVIDDRPGPPRVISMMIPGLREDEMVEYQYEYSVPTVAEYQGYLGVPHARIDSLELAVSAPGFDLNGEIGTSTSAWKKRFDRIQVCALEGGVGQQSCRLDFRRGSDRLSTAIEDVPKGNRIVWKVQAKRRPTSPARPEKPVGESSVQSY